MSDLPYLEKLWEEHVAYLEGFSEHLWIPLDKIKQFGPSAKMWVILCMSVLTPKFSEVQQAHEPQLHKFVSKKIIDAFNGRGDMASNERRVLACIIHRIKTKTYTKAVVGGEKSAGNGELRPHPARRIDAHKNGP